MWSSCLGVSCPCVGLTDIAHCCWVGLWLGHFVAVMLFFVNILYRYLNISTVGLSANSWSECTTAVPLSQNDEVMKLWGPYTDDEMLVVANETCYDASFSPFTLIPVFRVKCKVWTCNIFRQHCCNVIQRKTCSHRVNVKHFWRELIIIICRQWYRHTWENTISLQSTLLYSSLSNW